MATPAAAAVSAAASNNNKYKRKRLNINPASAERLTQEWEEAEAMEARNARNASDAMDTREEGHAHAHAHLDSTGQHNLKRHQSSTGTRTSTGTDMEQHDIKTKRKRVEEQYLPSPDMKSRIFLKQEQEQEQEHDQEAEKKTSIVPTEAAVDVNENGQAKKEQEELNNVVTASALPQITMTVPENKQNHANLKHNDDNDDGNGDEMEDDEVVKNVIVKKEEQEQEQEQDSTVETEVFACYRDLVAQVERNVEPEYTLVFYEGSLGISIEKSVEELPICVSAFSTPLADSQAYTLHGQRLNPFDEIVRVNDVDVSERGVDDFVEILTSQQPARPVRITFRRPAEEHLVARREEAQLQAELEAMAASIAERRRKCATTKRPPPQQKQQQGGSHSSHKRQRKAQTHTHTHRRNTAAGAATQARSQAQRNALYRSLLQKSAYRGEPELPGTRESMQSYEVPYDLATVKYLAHKLESKNEKRDGTTSAVSMSFYDMEKDRKEICHNAVFFRNQGVDVQPSTLANFEKMTLTLADQAKRIIAKEEGRFDRQRALTMTMERRAATAVERAKKQRDIAANAKCGYRTAKEEMRRAKRAQKEVSQANSKLRSQMSERVKKMSELAAKLEKRSAQNSKIRKTLSRHMQDASQERKHTNAKMALLQSQLDSTRQEVRSLNRADLGVISNDTNAALVNAKDNTKYKAKYRAAQEELKKAQEREERRMLREQSVAKDQVKRFRKQLAKAITNVLQPPFSWDPRDKHADKARKFAVPVEGCPPHIYKELFGSVGTKMDSKGEEKNNKGKENAQGSSKTDKKQRLLTLQDIESALGKHFVRDFALPGGAASTDTVVVEMGPRSVVTYTKAKHSLSIMSSFTVRLENTVSALVGTIRHN